MFLDTFLTVPESMHSRIVNLSVSFKVHAETISWLGIIRAPLNTILKPKNNNKKLRNAEKGGRRWNNLLKEIENGIGEYSVEAMVI